MRRLGGGGLALLCLAMALPATVAGETALSPQARLAAAERLQLQGRRGEALRELEALAAALPPDGHAQLALTVESALGKAYLLAGEKEAARKRLERALVGARAQRLAALESALLNDLGQLELIEDRSTEALAAFEAARHAAASSGQPLQFSRATINAVRAMAFADRPERAAAWLGEALQHLQHAPDSNEKAYQLIALANLYRRHADVPGTREAAYRALASAARIAAGLNDARAESFALGHLGELYAVAGREAEALRLARRALFLAQLEGAHDALYRWHWQIGRLQAAAGRSDEAMAAYERAIDSLRAVRSDLMADLRAIRASWRDAAGPLFLEYTDLLLRRAAAAPPPQNRAWLVKARDTVEQLKTVELEDYFQDECVASLQAKKKSLDDPGAGTAVLYPILLPDRVEMLVSLPGDIRQVRLDIDGRRLGEEILALRRLLEKRTTHQYLPHAQAMHARLIGPVESLLAAAGVHTLVFIPDGPLRGMPLAALHDGRQFLVERYAIAVAPGLTLVEDAAGREGRRGGTLSGGITESVQDFPALPYVEPEMQAVQSLYGGKALKDAQFLIPRFEQELRQASYSVVHIASHGQIESDPRKSFLLAYDGRITMDHLEDYLKFSQLRQESVDLLTLSACRTAAGDDRAALGLAGMAVKAGARSALATLWYVSDQASSMLVTEFYRAMSAGGVGKAAALRQAQRTVLADPRYRHPGYWAPFLLIGNWQ
jgi:CHAT domain-containing protein